MYNLYVKQDRWGLLCRLIVKGEDCFIDSSLEEGLFVRLRNEKKALPKGSGHIVIKKNVFYVISEGFEAYIYIPF